VRLVPPHAGLDRGPGDRRRHRVHRRGHVRHAGLLARAVSRAVPSRVLQEAVRALRSGGLVAFPTETFYGLAALASDARALARLAGGPITATSANFAGDPPVTRAGDLPVALVERIDVVIPGATKGGAPSTIVAVRGDAIVLLRVGAVVV